MTTGHVSFGIKAGYYLVAIAVLIFVAMLALIIHS